ncbi:MAG: hypothetical protein R2861_13820 [Desulfobacterales bacterium]
MMKKAAAKFLKPECCNYSMKQLTDAVSAMEAFTEKDLEDVLNRSWKLPGSGFGKIAQPVQVASPEKP